MGILSKIFRREPAAKGPRKRMCIQCGSILPEHVHWCPVGSEQQKAKKAQAAG